MAVHLDVTSSAGGWSIRGASTLGAAAGIPRAVRAAAVAPELPEPLRDPTKFEPTDYFEAEVRPARRGLGASGVAVPPPLTVEVDAADDAPRVAVVRYSSQAVAFHFGEPAGPVIRRATRTRRRGGGAGGRVSFTIPIRDGAAGTTGPARRGILSKVIRVVVVKLIDLIARPVLRVLARELEEQLWKRDGRTEGWLRITDAGIAAGRLEHDVPGAVVAGSGPALLLIHGTFSNTWSAFRDLLTSDAMGELRARYGEEIYGFDHFTFSKAPQDNVQEMLAALGPGRRTFDVVSHSRGGLVLRTLVANSRGRIDVRRAVPVAAPNLGTPLATPQRWEETIGWFANLLEMFPANPFTTAGAWVANALSWVAQHATGDLPGLASMDGNGTVVSTLAGVPAADAAAEGWYAITADYAPRNAGMIARLADMGVDRFFQVPNDLVVPTVGSWRLDPRGEHAVPLEHVACFGPGWNVQASSGDAVHHLNYFAQRETRDVILRALAGEALGLLPVDESRATRRGVAAAAARPRYALARPGAGSGIGGGERAGATGAAASCGGGPSDRPGRGPDGSDGERSGLGWNDEDSLQLVVLPLPEFVGKGRKRTAQLLATYGSARVLAPFRLSGQGDEPDVEQKLEAKRKQRKVPEDDPSLPDKAAGRRWQQVIAFQKQLEALADYGTPLTEDMLRRGRRALFDVLFQKDVLRLYDQARFLHVRRRLNVVFTSIIDWVADLPWELAFDESCKSYLSLSDVRFVRNVLTPVPADRIKPSSRPLRILVVSAVPNNQQQLSEDEEKEAITRSFRRLVDRGLAEVEPLARATPTKLHAKVRADTGCYDVVHFIGHGRFDENAQTGYLIFEDENGGTSEMSTDEVRAVLRGRGIRLLFLNACVSARGGRAEYNKGVAPGLVADGVPAVVANQYSVLDASATMFAKHFYWCLVQGLSLGDAMRESRIALNYLIDSGVDWAVPVLFALNPNARLRTPLPGDGDGSDLFDVEDDRVTPAGAPFASGSGPTPWDAAIVTPRGADRAWRGRRRVAVWDVADTLPDLERYLAQMTAAQDVFSFEARNLTAPLGTWKPRSDKDLPDTARHAYLSAEMIAEKMRNVVTSLGVDLLLCVTDLPLGDRRMLNLYLWSDRDKDVQNPTLRGNRIAIFSTWGFEPPITRFDLPKALANVAVQALASTLVGEDPGEAPEGSIAYFNKERNVDLVVGRLTIEPKHRRKITAKLGTEVVQAFERLLALYHPGEGRGSSPRRRKRSNVIIKTPRTRAIANQKAALAKRKR